MFEWEDEGRGEGREKGGEDSLPLRIQGKLLEVVGIKGRAWGKMREE